MKAIIKGSKNLSELRASLNQAIDDMERFGIEQVKSCNLYFTPTDPEGKEKKLNMRGKKFESCTVSKSYDCAADHYDA